MTGCWCFCFAPLNLVSCVRSRDHNVSFRYAPCFDRRCSRSHLGLPDHCDIATEPLEVLTDLVVLFTFSLAQVSSILAYVHSGRMLVSRRASQAVRTSGTNSRNSAQIEHWGAEFRPLMSDPVAMPYQHISVSHRILSLLYEYMPSTGHCVCRLSEV